FGCTRLIGQFLERAGRFPLQTTSLGETRITSLREWPAREMPASRSLVALDRSGWLASESQRTTSADCACRQQWAGRSRRARTKPDTSTLSYLLTTVGYADSARTPQSLARQS